MAWWARMRIYKQGIHFVSQASSVEQTDLKQNYLHWKSWFSFTYNKIQKGDCDFHQIILELANKLAFSYAYGDQAR